MKPKNIILAFISTYVVTFTSVLYFFVCLQVTVKCLFISACRTPFSISHRDGLLVMNSVLFVWQCLNFSLIFEGKFCQIWEFFVDTFPPALTMLSHCLLASLASNVDLAIKLTEDFLFMMSHFALAALRSSFCKVWL